MKVVWVIVMAICSGLLSYRVATYDYLYFQAVPIFVLASTCALVPWFTKANRWLWLIFCLICPLIYAVAVLLYVSAALQFAVCGGLTLVLFAYLVESPKRIRIGVFTGVLFILGFALDCLWLSDSARMGLSASVQDMVGGFEFRILVWQTLLLPMLASLFDARVSSGTK